LPVPHHHLHPKQGDCVQIAHWLVLTPELCPVTGWDCWLAMAETLAGTMLKGKLYGELGARA